MNTDITLFNPQSVTIIVQGATQAYKENIVSHDRCLQCGQELLSRAHSEGMSDTLDKEIATFLTRAKNTLKKMNAKRSAVTQVFDKIRSAYTSLENNIDTTKQATIPAQLQEIRNAYAAQKHAEQEAELRKRQIEQEKANAKAKFAAEVEADFLRQFDCLITETCNSLIEIDKALTSENYDNIYNTIVNVSDKLPDEWYNNLKALVVYTPILSQEEMHAIAADVKQKMHQRFTEQYTFEISTTRDELLNRLPFKRKELERIAQADKEDAERMKQQLEDAERKEAERREAERAEREAQNKAAAELQVQQQEMYSLFDAAELQVNNYQTNASVKKRINVLNAEGFMQVVGLWWAQYGCTLSVEELSKVFAKQLTYCNKLANDKNHPVLIQSEHIEYIDEVKAK